MADPVEVEVMSTGGEGEEGGLGVAIGLWPMQSRCHERYDGLYASGEWNRSMNGRLVFLGSQNTTGGTWGRGGGKGLWEREVRNASGNRHGRKMHERCHLMYIKTICVTGHILVPLPCE